MGLTLLIDLIMLVSLATVVQNQVIPVCDPSDYSLADPPLPQLPDQFYMAMEATLVERNLSVYAVEYFDGPGNRGRMDFTIRGRKINTVIDYNLKEAFVYPNPSTGDDCTVSLLNVNSSQTNPEVRFIFGIAPGPNNTVQIGSPSLFFSLVNVTNATFMGVKDDNITRGVSTYHWKTCTSNDYSSYTLHYYFTNSTIWNATYPDANNYIPVAIYMIGNRWNAATNTSVYFEHYYSFVVFNSGPSSVPDDAFSIPLDLVCKGRIPGQPLPQFPNVFSAGVEYVGSTGVSTFREYYDYTHQLLRVDGYSRNYSVPFTLIHDFNIGAQYIIDQNTQSCYIQNLTKQNTFYDSTVDSGGQLHLQSLRNLFLANDQYNFSYEGVTTVRGLMVDVWISPRDFQQYYRTNITNGVYNLYFTRPGQQVASEFSVTTDPVIVQTKFSGFARTGLPDGTIDEQNFTVTTSLFGFTPSEPPLDVFDTSVCYSPSDYVMIRFTVPSNVTFNSQTQFRSDIRSAFMKYAANISMPFKSPLQINSIQIDSKSISNSILVSLHMTNLTSNASARWDYTAQAIYNRLTSGLQNNSKLPFSIIFTSNPPVEAYPLFIVNKYCNNTIPPRNNTIIQPCNNTIVQPCNNTIMQPCNNTIVQSCDGRVRSGVVVAATLTMLIVGIIIGIIVGLVICVCVQHFKSHKFTPSSNDPKEEGRYERHFDETGDDIDLQAPPSSL